MAQRIEQRGARFNAGAVRLAINLQGNGDFAGPGDFRTGLSLGFGFENAGCQCAAGNADALEETTAGKVGFAFLGFFRFRA